MTPIQQFALYVITCWLSLGSMASAQLEVSPDHRYLFLATQRTSTMQDELEQAAALGFRIVTGTTTSENEIAIFLEKAVTPPKVYEYRLLATSRTGTRQKELSSAAAEGFRLLPRTMMYKTARWVGNDEVVAVLERSPDANAPHYEYLLLATTLTGSLQNEVSQAVDRGFTLVGLTSQNEHVAILERQLP